jgi:hypothetical protein
MGDVVLLRRFLDPMEAELAHAQLVTAGIWSLVSDPTAHHPELRASQGAELRVREEDLAEAELILDAQSIEDPTANRGVRTVFRLQRRSPGMGLFLGLCAGLVVDWIVGPSPSVFLTALTTCGAIG